MYLNRCWIAPAARVLNRTNCILRRGAGAAEGSRQRKGMLRGREEIEYCQEYRDASLPFSSSITRDDCHDDDEEEEEEVVAC